MKSCMLPRMHVTCDLIVCVLYPMAFVFDTERQYSVPTCVMNRRLYLCEQRKTIHADSVIHYRVPQ